jgi:hypothetical protein
MTARKKRTLGQRIGDFVASKKKAIAAGVSQLVTTGLTWVGLHAGLHLDAETSKWISATVGALVSAAVVYLVRNELR